MRVIIWTMLPIGDMIREKLVVAALLLLLLPERSHYWDTTRLKMLRRTCGITYLIVHQAPSLKNNYIPTVKLLHNPAAGIFYMAYSHRIPMLWEALGPRVAETVSPAVDHFPTGLSVTTPHKHGMFCLTKLQKPHLSRNQPFFKKKNIKHHTPCKL